MKKLFLITLVLALLVIFSFPMSFAGDKDKKVEYAVTINITYNALSIADANKIVGDILEKHQDACKVNVEINKGDTLTIAAFAIINDDGTVSYR